MNCKHAYLILVHKNWEQLRKLIELIDDERNDIFLHIDRKSRISADEMRRISQVAVHSNITMVKRHRISWGGYSIVKAEFELLNTAIHAGAYCYYHLISSMDLPVRTNDEIHAFFDRNQGKEFVRLSEACHIDMFRPRLKYYWFFQELIGKSRKNPLRIVQWISIQIQKIIGVNRIRDFTFAKGHQWFSITDDFARYVCENEPSVRKRLRFTFCADESMIQPLIVDSIFKDRIYKPEPNENEIMRAIDWNRGSPYVFRKEDYDFLMKTKCMFARKFDEETDDEIIEMIYSTLMHKKLQM